MKSREQVIAEAPDRIWADVVMGIWLGADQPDRRSPVVEYVRADRHHPAPTAGSPASAVTDADIVEQLRHTAGHLINETMEDGGVSSFMLVDAADEIERLRPYEVELRRIAEDLGEPTDPFAAWETLAGRFPTTAMTQQPFDLASFQKEAETWEDVESEQKIHHINGPFASPLPPSDAAREALTSMAEYARQVVAELMKLTPDGQVPERLDALLKIAIGKSRLALSAAPVSAWQDVASVPKDGSPIDVFTETNHRWIDVRWDAEQHFTSFTTASAKDRKWDDRPIVPASVVTHWRRPDVPTIPRNDDQSGGARS